MLPSIAASSSGHCSQDGSRGKPPRISPPSSSATQCRHSPRKPSTRPDALAAALRQRRGELARRQRRPAGRDQADRLAAARRCGCARGHRHRPAASTGTRERQRVIGRVAGQAAPRIEAAAGGAADMAAGGEARGQRRARGCRCRPRGPAGWHGPHRSRASARDLRLDRGERRADRRRAVRREVVGDAAGHHAVHHQPVAEGDGAGAQHAFAQHAAARMRQGEGGVVADEAPVVQVVVRCAPAPPSAARSATARGGGGDAPAPPRRPCAKAQACATVESPDSRAAKRAAARGGLPSISPMRALVRVAQPLLQPHHRLALDVEAEMAGLDDAGMHRADRDLVHALALDGRKFGLRRRHGIGARRCAESGAGDRPAAMVEPGAQVDRALRHQAPEVADRRARTAPRRGGPGTSAG